MLRSRFQLHDLAAAHERAACKFYPFHNLRWSHGEQVFVRSRAESGIDDAVFDPDFSPFRNVNRRGVLDALRHQLPQYLLLSTRNDADTKGSLALERSRQCAKPYDERGRA